MKNFKLPKAILALTLSSAILAPNIGANAVMTWIAPYSAKGVKKVVEANPQFVKGLSRVGLQFWNPSADGKSVVLAPTDGGGENFIKEEDIAYWADWGRKNKIGMFLTVYNNSEIIRKWDWLIVQAVIKDENRTSFINSMLRIVDRHNLAGIDVDLEGGSTFLGDKENFNKMIFALSDSLHARNKKLTVDTFHSPCYNAPNMTWWKDWKGKVDNIHTMGYGDLYEGNKTKLGCTGEGNTFSYSFQQQYALDAGLDSNVVLMGAPGWLNEWGKDGLGERPQDHIQEIQALGTGIAIWDLNLRRDNWVADETWDSLQVMKETGDVDNFDFTVPIHTNTLSGSIFELKTYDSKGLTLKKTTQKASITLFDAQAKVYFSNEFDVGSQQIQFESPLKGNFILRIKSKGESYSRVLNLKGSSEESVGKSKHLS
jgi:hypothetical protein